LRHSSANSPWITADGQTVASAGDMVRVWNLWDPEAPALTFEHDNVCALSADGSCLVLGAPSGSLRALRPPNADAAVEIVGSRTSGMIAVSTDGELIVALGEGRTARVWDSRTGLPLVTLAGDLSEVLSLAVSADKTLVVASRRDGSITTYDLSSGQPLHALPGNEEWVRGCSITRSSRFLASARSDGSLTLWDVRTGERLCVLHVNGFLFDCSWFSDDERIVAAGTRGVYFLKRLDA
jgi:WD40 repeat protein